MALALLTTPVANVTPISAALWIAEFNNLYNNALSLISPLTGNLAFGGNIATGLGLGSVTSPALQFTSDANTGVYSSAADTVDIAVGGVRAASFITATTGVNYFKFTPSAASAALQLDAEGTDTNIQINYDTKGSGDHVWRASGGSSELMRLDATTASLMIGTTVGTNLGSKAIGLGGSGALQFLQDSGTDFENFGIYPASDLMTLNVPSTSSVFTFRFATTSPLRLKCENGGGGVLFLTESSADHSAPAANQAVMYTKDVGGKTTLFARFASGAVQTVSAEP